MLRDGCYSYDSACGYYFSTTNAYSANFLTLDGKDTVSTNHPAYDDMMRSWQVMRHSSDGQDAIRKNAIDMDYIQIPPGLIEYDKIVGPNISYKTALNKNAVHHYVNKAHYIPIVSRIIEEIVGKIFSKPYKISLPNKLDDLKDVLDSEGLSFEEFARWCVREVFTVTRFGVLADWDNETDKPVIKRYTAESIVNWKTNKRGELILLVLEDMIEDEAQVFSHNKKTRRISFTVELDENRNPQVVQRTWVKDTKKQKFEEFESPIVLQKRGFQLKNIPFTFFGGIKPEAPILRPLADTALEFFDAHAQYRNSMWWASNVQPVISFKDDGGFWGVDESRDGSDTGNSSDTEEISFGSMNPILLVDGEFKLVEVAGNSLSAQRQRLTDIRAEMTGMSARSFNAQTASNIKVQTERMQNRSESSIIQSIAKFISRGIRNILQIVAVWADIKGEIKFELNKDYVEDFDIKYLPHLIDSVERGYFTLEHFFMFIKKNSEMIPDDQSFDDYVKAVQRHRASSFVFENSDVDEEDEDYKDDLDINEAVRIELNNDSRT